MIDDVTRSRIQALIQERRVVLFMKGTKQFPMCGFSSRVVAILKSLEVDFATVNVLADESIRQGIKEYSDWPTIPQLYVAGKFVGGSDIVAELHERGELASLLGAGQN